jgi:small subunit ribosomal protein S8
MTDPIADMLTRLRNALAVKKEEVSIPSSKVKLAIAEILKKNDYILNYKQSNDNFGEINIVLKYNESNPAITNLKRISKPGRRVYVTKDNLPSVLNNLGIAIISTPHGIMTNKEARKKATGGEILCEIY